MARTSKLDLRVFQQELAQRLASKTTAQVESSRLGLSFGGDNWLVRLADAGEVIPIPSIASVPLTKPWFLGITNIRGNLYSVTDFAAFLGRAPTPLTRGSGGQARLVLFGPRTGELHAGVVVSRVIGLRNLTELAPTAAPTDAPAWYGQRWMDADGVAWQEIDLSRLARDAAFLQVGQ
jgi:twitching motility protein PilI